MQHKLILFAAALSASGAGAAATRSYIVTDFESMRLEGSIDVTVQTGRGISARGEGDADALERVDLNVSGRQLTIRLKPALFEARRDKPTGPIKILITVPELRRAQLSGSGSLRVTGLSKTRAEVASIGSGSLSVSGIDTDDLGVIQLGSGSLQLAGKAKTAKMQVSGSGALDGKALAVADLMLTSDGASSIAVRADRAAKIIATGSGNLLVEGKAACTVSHTGSGVIRCGGKTY